jgi:hypothetical protein
VSIAAEFIYREFNRFFGNIGIEFNQLFEQDLRQDNLLLIAPACVVGECFGLWGIAIYRRILAVLGRKEIYGCLFNLFFCYEFWHGVIPPLR